jgi:putative addiction module antidote
MMNTKLSISQAKVKTIDDSLGIVFPSEVLAKLRVNDGDSLYFTETPDGMLLTKYPSIFAKAMEIADKIMRENPDAFRKLAK